MNPAVILTCKNEIADSLFFIRGLSANGAMSLERYTSNICLTCYPGKEGALFRKPVASPGDDRWSDQVGLYPGSDVLSRHERQV